jgi:hypothetical protein
MQRVRNALWIIAFAALCAGWGYELTRAVAHQRAAAVPWICPIAGQCGPAETPGLGRW